MNSTCADGKRTEVHGDQRGVCARARKKSTSIRDGWS